ncbi:MAG TPA: bifunctional UDP-N-acetylglucosamine diphosphorylase/glucosamine-1-phosphate N-acetyltransferase GlmU [Micropepsaceae bacterium]|jgi:bifunctional UDP-N-acetylglucosamine pyrophosphorylase/glucosamine-1-phosphate N-acetyltransferase|nr:bifunctional UDP-N-acetylglucosamine diphosphorylase/glucosamine-1-phosphate N-acetyltransferase GlmU [Micropepsaceae bacterium]
MNRSALAVVVLAAGQGTRMKSALPKVLHPIGGRPMLGHVLAVTKAMQAERIVVVTAPGATQVEKLVEQWGAAAVVQERQLGTGHAVLAAESLLSDFDGNLMVLFGDAPLLTAATLQELTARLAEGADITALGFRAADPTGYGRMVGQGDSLLRIVEQKDATEDERRIDRCFAGMLAGRAKLLLELLHQVGNHNAQGEFYLTDVITIARSRGLNCVIVEGPESEMLGVNSRSQLAQAEASFQARARAALMDAGITMLAPETIYLSADTIIEPDVTIGQFVVFGPGVTVKRGAEIRAFCHIENSEIGERAIIGPFARLRGGAKLDSDTDIGNFVELKNAHLEKGVKAHHLTYLGDAHVGEKANIGAGTITCNYDGFAKHRTEIGAGAFIGSNAALVAPVQIGQGAIVAAGSVITRSVEANALAVGRGRQEVKPGGAEVIRAKNKARKDRKI